MTELDLHSYSTHFMRYNTPTPEQQKQVFHLCEEKNL